MSIVFDYRKLSPGDFTHNKPIKDTRRGKFYYSSVFYKDNGKRRDVCIQTPKMTLGSDLCMTGSRGYVDLEFGEGTGEFYNFMVGMDEANIRAAHTNSNKWFNMEETLSLDLIEDRYRSSIRASKVHGGASSMRVYFQLDSEGNLDTGIYNEHKIKVDASCIRKGMKCIVLLRLDSLWVAKEHIGCDWVAEQVKVYTGEMKTRRFEHCVIDDLEEDLNVDEDVEDVFRGDEYLEDDLEGVTLKEDLVIE